MSGPLDQPITCRGIDNMWEGLPSSVAVWSPGADCKWLSLEMKEDCPELGEMPEGEEGEREERGRGVEGGGGWEGRREGGIVREGEREEGWEGGREGGGFGGREGGREGERRQRGEEGIHQCLSVKGTVGTCRDEVDSI